MSLAGASEVGHRAAASRANSSRVSSSGRRVSVDAGALEDALGGPLGQRAAQHLAPLGERGAHDLEELRPRSPPSGSTRTLSRRTIDTSADSTWGRGRKTAGPTRPTTCASAKYWTRSDTAP